MASHQICWWLPAQLCVPGSRLLTPGWKQPLEKLLLVSHKNLSLGFSSFNCTSTTVKKLTLCRFPALLFSCLSLNSTRSEQLCKGFVLLPEWRSTQRALVLQGEHCGAYTHSATEVKLSRREEVGPVLSLLSAFCGNYRPHQPPVCVEEEKTHPTGSDQRAVLAKCLLACNKCLHKERKKKRKYYFTGSYFTGSYSPDSLSWSLISDSEASWVQGCTGAIVCSPKQWPLAHRWDFVSRTWHEAFHVLPALRQATHCSSTGKAKEVPQLVPAACHWC